MNGTKAYLIAATAILFSYSALAVVLAETRDFSNQGPASFHSPELASPLSDNLSLEGVRERCLIGSYSNHRTKVVGGRLGRVVLYGCYEVNTIDGTVSEAVLLDASSGEIIRDVGLIKRSGAWPWIGSITTGSELLFWGLFIVALSMVFYIYYQPRRPGPPATGVKWWQRQGTMLAFAVLLPIIGLVIVAALPQVSRARKHRVLLQAVIIWGGVLVVSLWSSEYHDHWSLGVAGLVSVAFLHGLFGGRAWVRPEGFALPEALPATSVPDRTPAAAGAPPSAEAPVREGHSEAHGELSTVDPHDRDTKPGWKRVAAATLILLGVFNGLAQAVHATGQVLTIGNIVIALLTGLLAWDRDVLQPRR
jgi:hypothetical protein